MKLSIVFVAAFALVLANKTLANEFEPSQILGDPIDQESAEPVDLSTPAPGSNGPGTPPDSMNSIIGSPVIGAPGSPGSPLDIPESLDAPEKPGANIGLTPPSSTETTEISVQTSAAASISMIGSVVTAVAVTAAYFM
jgi:hypothetical protein